MPFRRDFWDKAELEQLYHIEEKTLLEIAGLKNCSITAVFRAMRKLGVDTRRHSFGNPLITKRGEDIGKRKGILYELVACPDCGKKRYVNKHHKSERCAKCWRIILAHWNEQHNCGEHNPCWRGGRIKLSGGYIGINLQPDDFFYPMTGKDHYVLEHRLVVAKALGRCLHSWEIVHHKRGFAKDDNRYPETLQLVTDDRHKQITILENRIGYLEKRVTLLEAENAAMNLLLEQVRSE